jgi:hypothetical protein
MIDDHSNSKLEELIDREFSKLTERPAPQTLIPRVLATIQARAQKRWWRESWFGWPIGPKVISIAFLAALVPIAFSGGAMAWAGATNPIFLETVHGWITTLVAMGGILSTLANAITLILSSIGRFWMCLGLTIALLMYLSCVGIGTLCFRLALNKR